LALVRYEGGRRRYEEGVVAAVDTTADLTSGEPARKAIVRGWICNVIAIATEGYMTDVVEQEF
jgi:hypothetical protein